MARIWRIKAGMPPTIRAIREIRGQLPMRESSKSSQQNKNCEQCNTGARRKLGVDGGWETAGPSSRGTGTGEEVATVGGAITS